MKNSEIKQQNYQKIKASASTLFFIFGLEYTDMYQIASASGLSKASLYKYFNTKYDLARELLEDALEERGTELSAVWQDTPEGSGAEDMRRLLDHVVDISESDLPFYALYMEYAMHIQRFAVSSAPVFLEKSAEKLKTRFLSILEKGLADGTLITDLEPQLLYGSVIGSLQGCCARFFLMNGGRMDAERFRELRTELAFTAQAAMNMMTK